MKSQTEHSGPPSCSSWLSFPLLLPSSNIPLQQDLKCPNSKQSLWAFLLPFNGCGALQVSTSPGKCAQTQRETSPDCLITTDLLSTVWFKVYAVKILSLIISALSHITFISRPSHKLSQASNLRVALTCCFSITDPWNSFTMFGYSLVPLYIRCL